MSARQIAALLKSSREDGWTDSNNNQYFHQVHNNNNSNMINTTMYPEQQLSSDLLIGQNVANHYRASYCSKQNLYRASYCPPPTSYTNQYGLPMNHYPHTAYQYPNTNQHVTTNQYITHQYPPHTYPIDPRPIGSTPNHQHHPPHIRAKIQRQIDKANKKKNPSYKKNTKLVPVIKKARRHQKDAVSLVLVEKNKRKQLTALEESLKTEKQELKSFYSPTITINTKAAIASDRLADRYRSDFNSKSEEKVDLLKLLKSHYNYELHKKKEGFDEVVFQCLECGIELRYMNWYLRLNGRYGKFPFVGNSNADYLLHFIKNPTNFAKRQKCLIQSKREKHLIVPRGIKDAICMTASLLNQIDANSSLKENHVKRAEKVFSKLPDMLCYDEDEGSYEDLFDVSL